MVQEFVHPQYASLTHGCFFSPVEDSRLEKRRWVPLELRWVTTKSRGGVPIQLQPSVCSKQMGAPWVELLKKHLAHIIALTYQFGMLKNRVFRRFPEKHDPYNACGSHPCTKAQLSYAWNESGTNSSAWCCLKVCLDDEKQTRATQRTYTNRSGCARDLFEGTLLGGFK